MEPYTEDEVYRLNLFANDRKEPYRICTSCRYWTDIRRINETGECGDCEDSMRPRELDY